MSENKENIDRKILKSIKVRPALHRQIKADAVEHDENIEDTVERAWRGYKGTAQTINNKRDEPFTPGTIAPEESLDLSRVRTVPFRRPGPGVDASLLDLTPTEQDSVALLLLILRNASPTVKEAIKMNLRGFAEPILSGVARGGESEGGTLSQALDRVVNAIEELGAEEANIGRWLADIREMQAKIGGAGGKPAEPRKRGGKGGG